MLQLDEPDVTQQAESVWAPPARIGAVPVVAFAALASAADPDLWGHLRFGLDILRTHTLTSIDPYAFTADRAWINHEWLSEVAFALAYRLGDATGLLVLKTIVVGTALGAVWWRSAGCDPRLRFAALATAAWGGLGLTITVRPQLWTFVILAWLLPCLETHPWCAPLLFVAAANLHGGWIVLLTIAGVWAVDRAWRTRDVRQPALVLAACAVATLVTPYGWTLWKFLGETVRMERPGILEWQPVDAAQPLAWIPWVVATVALLYRTVRAPSIWGPALLAFAVAALRVKRLVPLYVLVTIVQTLPPRETIRVSVEPVRRLIEVAAEAAILITLFVVIGPQARCLKSASLWRPDPVVAPTIETLSGRVAVWFSWGEYVIWHRGGPVRVSMDGRRETVYTEATLDRQGAVAAGASDGVAWIATERPDYLWYPASRRTLRAALTQLPYRIDIETPDSFLATRADLPRVVPTAADWNRTACFPNP